MPKPGMLTASGKAILRLIVGVRRDNNLLMDIDGGMDKLPLCSSMLCARVFPHEVAVLGAADLSASFYLLSMPAGWHQDLVSRWAVSCAAIGRPGLVPFYLAAVVLPRGYKLGT